MSPRNAIFRSLNTFTEWLKCSPKQLSLAVLPPAISENYVCFVFYLFYVPSHKSCVCHCAVLLLLVFSHSAMSDSFATPCTVAHCPWDFPGKITGVACHWLPHLHIIPEQNRGLE